VHPWDSLQRVEWEAGWLKTSLSNLEIKGKILHQKREGKKGRSLLAKQPLTKNVEVSRRVVGVNWTKESRTAVGGL